MTQATFFVPGTPRPQLRPRAFATSKGARVYDPKTAEGWKSAVAEAAREFLPAEPITGWVSVAIAFMFPRPKSHYGTGRNAGNRKQSAPWEHTSRPDLDNLAKPILDALSTLGWWKDDAQVTRLDLEKCYGNPRKEGASVWIEWADPPEKAAQEA